MFDSFIMLPYQPKWKINVRPVDVVCYLLFTIQSAESDLFNLKSIVQQIIWYTLGRPRRHVSTSPSLDCRRIFVSFFFFKPIHWWLMVGENSSSKCEHISVRQKATMEAWVKSSYYVQESSPKLTYCLWQGTGRRSHRWHFLFWFSKSLFLNPAEQMTGEWCLITENII